MKFRRALVAAGPPLAAAVLGAITSRNAPQVYGRLTKPRWAPPSRVFGPTWTALYGLMGFSGWRMVAAGVRRRTWILHGLQLAMNACWSLLFFGVRDKRAALVLVAALDLTVGAEIVDLTRQDRAAALGLIPYLGWSLFATALNASVSDPGEICRLQRCRP